MVNNNGIPIEVNKKPFETVYELKNEIPSFEEFMKSYESDSNLNYDDLSSCDVGEVKGYGPCTDGRNKVYCYCSSEQLRIQIINNTYNVYVSPTSTNRIFRLGFRVWNQKNWGRVAIFHEVDEAIRSISNIVAGQKDSHYGHDWRDESGFFGSRSLNHKVRSAASAALQSVVQSYQGDNNVDGWLEVQGRFGDDPEVTWNYSCGTTKNGGSLAGRETAC